MTTTAASLIESIRDRVNDYGGASTILSAALTNSASDTTVFVADANTIAPGQKLQVNNELMVVTEVVLSTTPHRLTVRRAQRGTSVASHVAGDTVYVDIIYSNQRILDALNTALGSAYPTLYIIVDDATTHFAVGTDKYDLPTGLDELCRVEMESYVGSGVFVPTRFFERDDVHVRLFSSWSDGQHIRIVGMKRFTAMTLSGNLDSSYPTSTPAYMYLVYQAIAQLLTERQGEVGKLDSSVGITDAFAEGDPYASARSALYFKKLAAEQLAEAAMPEIEHMDPHPLRRYEAGF